MYSLDYGMVRCIMGNFMLFVGWYYYPCVPGKNGDYVGRFENITEAKQAALSRWLLDNYVQWVSIYDIVNDTFTTFDFDKKGQLVERTGPYDN